MTAEDLIRRYHLQSHPEGGHFAETFRSPQTSPNAAGLSRSRYTSIYFLLKKGEFSSLHRLQADEIWYHHLGGELEISILYPDGRLEQHRLGPETDLQVLVPAGTWFGARPLSGDFVLVGCAMAPGFEFADFELGDRQTLGREYPAHRALIESLTHA